MPQLAYAPRRIFLPYHLRTQRWAAIVAHRRCGKTVACIVDLITRAASTPKQDGRYAYIAPFFNQAKDVAWLYLKRYSEPIWTASPNESDLWVQVRGGARVRLYGADNPDRLRGPYLDGVVLDEYADMDPRVWGEVIRPMLTDRKGGATFIGTPKGHNAFWEQYGKAEAEPAEWFSACFRASQTGILDQEELDSARRDMTPEQYEQEFECSFEAAILGAYFGKEMAGAERAGRITAVERLPDVPVQTAWDLGVGQHMAIWCFQVTPTEIRVIDYLSAYGWAMDRYCMELNGRSYTGTDWVPHDAKTPSMETGRTRVESLIEYGRKPRLVPDHKVDDGIQGARLTFPRVWFDAAKCKDGLEALRQYRADYDDKLKVFRKQPRHDWASHPADAFRYLCMAWREVKPPPPEPEKKPPSRITDVTVNQLWKMHEEDMLRMRD